MNLRDALASAETHGVDRMPVDVDRRLRRRLELEAETRSVFGRVGWLRPALGGLVVAAAVVAIIVVKDRSSAPKRPSQVAAATSGLVDVSERSWTGTVTADHLDVRADSPSSATVKWRDAAIVAAPGTVVTASSASLVLTQGAIELRRTDATPLFVDVPVGRVVIAAYHSKVTADRESVTLLVDDGTGHYIDGDGRTHALLPGTPLTWPPKEIPSDGSASTQGSAASVAVPPSRHRGNGRASVAPAAGSSQPAGAHDEIPALSAPRPPSVRCTFKSDCDPGATCREDETGTSVCMGNGVAGAACWFNSDCQSQACVQRRCAAPPTGQ